MIWLSVLSCIFAVIPASLFLRNLWLYRLLPQTRSLGAKCSVLIPARNEEANIGARAAVGSAKRRSRDRSDCARRPVDRPHRGDRARDRAHRPAGPPRNRAAAARRLVRKKFRLSSPRRTRASFAFGFHGCRCACLAARLACASRGLRRAKRPRARQRNPREETYGLMEKLIIPLIHFVLLGFLSFDRMRAEPIRALRALAAKSSP